MAPLARFAAWPPLDATPVSVRRSHRYLRARFPVVELKHTGSRPSCPRSGNGKVDVLRT